MKKPSKAVIIGLDAATWTLIRPWMAEGGMPNLAKLINAGVSGTLQSVLPPITPPAWTSFMTGKNPGKHGIFLFRPANGGVPGGRRIDGLRIIDIAPMILQIFDLPVPVDMEGKAIASPIYHDYAAS